MLLNTFCVYNRNLQSSLSVNINIDQFSNMDKLFIIFGNLYFVLESKGLDLVIFYKYHLI